MVVAVAVGGAGGGVGGDAAVPVVAIMVGC